MQTCHGKSIGLFQNRYLGFLLIPLCLVNLASSAAAATLTVTSNADDGGGSLRRAIAFAISGDTIEFAVSGTIALTNGTLLIENDLTINGPGADQLAVVGTADWDNGVAIGTPFTISSNSIVAISDLKIVGQTLGEDTFGGAISNAGNLTLRSCLITDSSAGNGGGGIFSSGTMVLNDCVINRNYLNSWRDCLGAGIFNSGTMTLNNCSISENIGSTGGYGLGIGLYNSGALILNSCIVSGNYGFRGVGGGICNENNGTLILSKCTISNNRGYHDSSSGMVGGGVNNYGLATMTDCLVLDNNCGAGGGIYNHNSIAITNCTISGNWVGNDTGVGAGLFNFGSATLENTTVSGNTTTGGSDGGGIDNWGMLTLISSTVVSNRTSTTYSSDRGGGINNSGTVNSRNSIIAGNVTIGAGPDFYGTLNSQGYNLIQDTNGCTIVGDTTGNLIGVDPVLAPLDDYGGPTLTHALLSGSPAIDGGSPASFPATDQRGHARPYGAASDMGAFESSPPYVIRGTLSGFTLNEPLTLLGSLGVPVNPSRGRYSIEGQDANSYTITPSNANFHIVPSNQIVTVGPDQLGVNFKAYRWNALSMEGISDGVLHLIYAGTNGDNIRTLASSDLLNWSPISTNTVPPTNLFDVFDTSGQPWRFYRTMKP